jgi:HSP20 family molecular chaperone IbpA
MSNFVLNRTFFSRRTLRRSLAPALIGVTTLGFCVVAALGYQNYRLNHEIRQLQNQTASSRVMELIESTQQAQAPDSQALGGHQQDPFAALFASPFGSSFGPPFTGTPGFADPFQQMNSLRQQMESFFGGTTQPSARVGGQAFAGQPDILLRESPEALEFVIPVQEGTQLELNTDLRDNRLTIAGTLQWHEESSSGGRFYSSARSSQFSRTVPLPGDVDATGVVTEHRGDEVVVRVPRV